MIFKTFELNKINFEKINFYLFYGENEGLKTEIIKKKFEINFNEKIYRYDEAEIINNEQNFFNTIYSKSFFENEKLIIISRVSEKIKNIIEEIIQKKTTEIKIIINSGILDKKSKLRNFFEKDKETICVPFYTDTSQTMMSEIVKFFKEKKISISQESINLLVDRTSGDRQNLINEMNKIENFTQKTKKINFDDVVKLTNLAENYSVSELTDNCLAKNQRKIMNILNENNYNNEDCILILRTLLTKSKRLLKLNKNVEGNTNLDQVISSYRPPIFWKEKEIVKKQIQSWSSKNIEKLIYNINEIELTIKKNTINSINILSDFIITQSKNN
jgi:DNA polymerase-3 subunit delta